MDTESFATQDSNPVTAVTADEMRDVDRVAVETFGVDLLQMMENAGRNLSTIVRETLARAAPDAAVTVVVGNGGNGGGGLCCARHLANRGVPVSVVLDRPAAELKGAAAQQHRVVDEMGIPVSTGAAVLEERDAEILVDALVGYGLRGALRGAAAAMVEAIEEHPAPVVSLDVPSGLDATTGERPGVAVSPERVVTLALPKTGLAALSCPLALADISVPAGVYERLDVTYEGPFDDAYLVELQRVTER
jgi:NAD(P)H-hydrate epimerase